MPVADRVMVECVISLRDVPPMPLSLFREAAARRGEAVSIQLQSSKRLGIVQGTPHDAEAPPALLRQCFIRNVCLNIFSDAFAAMQCISSMLRLGEADLQKFDCAPLCRRFELSVEYELLQRQIATLDADAMGMHCVKAVAEWCHRQLCEGVRQARPREPAPVERRVAPPTMQPCDVLRALNPHGKTTGRTFSLSTQDAGTYTRAAPPPKKDGSRLAECFVDGTRDVRVRALEQEAQHAPRSAAPTSTTPREQEVTEILDSLATEPHRLLASGSRKTAVVTPTSERLGVVVLRVPTGTPRLRREIEGELRLEDQLRSAKCIDAFIAYENRRDGVDVLKHRGESLRHAAAKRSVARDALQILALPLLECLRRLWRANVCHRDVKPDNVILRETQTPAGEARSKVRLIDLGLAGSITDDLWTSSLARGSMPYRPPSLCFLANMAAVMGPTAAHAALTQALIAWLRRIRGSADGPMEKRIPRAAELASFAIKTKGATACRPACVHASVWARLPKGRRVEMVQHRNTWSAICGSLCS